MRERVARLEQAIMEAVKSWPRPRYSKSSTILQALRAVSQISRL